jgi:hypothetical protein
MATTLTGTAKASFNWDYQNVDATVGNTANTSGYSYSRAFTNGTAINTIDLVYVTSGTLAASGTLNVDLAGSVTNFFGTTLTFARVKVMYLENTTDTSSSAIAFGNHAAPLVNWISAATSTVAVRNGGCLFLCAPDATAYAVTATTADGLKLTNSDGTNSATYKLCIAGASA